MGLLATTKPEAYLLACLQCLADGNGNPSAPNKIQENTAFLDTVLSERNARHWRDFQCSFPGKSRPGAGAFPKVYATYEKPECGEECADLSTFGPCTDNTTTTEEYNNYLELEVNDSCGLEWRVTKEEFRQTCEGRDARIAETLRRKANAIKRNLNAKGLAAFLENAGNYPSGDSSLTDTATVTVISNAGNIIPAGFAKIKANYRKNKYKGDLITIGGDTLATYYDVKAYQGGGQNATGNVDPLPSSKFVFDDNLDSIIQDVTGDSTSSYGITMPEGAFGVYTWNEYTGDFQENFETHLETTIDIDGLTYDYYVKYSPCGKFWDIGLKLHFCWLCIPDDQYCNGEGFKWLWKFDCGEFECDSLKIC